ncbi:hypothetical protein WS75_10595 [Burkholderia sp. FL-7-2-10-S1-D7]|nr:hypothetical protein WS75_10595 [Burkholderia sp. FL-7-2-10-S1-D7]
MLKDGCDRAPVEARRTDAEGIQRVVKGRTTSEVNEALPSKSETGCDILGECHPQRPPQGHDQTIRCP